MTKRIVEPRDFVFKTTPYAHQKDAFDLSRDREAFALFMEQGTGKTKVAIDTAAYLYDHGEIDAIVVLAPNGVHRNWTGLEIPAHLVDRIPFKSATWHSQRSTTLKFRRHLTDVAKYKDGLAVFAMNIEALSTKRGFEVLQKFLRFRRAKFIVDESTRIKSSTAKRTKNVVALRREATYRRILTGTPWTNSPFDIFEPFKFLDPEILGFASPTVFKHYFGVWEKRPLSEEAREKLRKLERGIAVKLIPGRDYFEELLSYANLDELRELLAPHVYRITKDECLDLPPKVFQRLPVELTPEQAKLYAQMSADLMVEFSGSRIVATIPLTKILRLQQIVGGFLPVDDPEHEFGAPIPGKNPKLEAVIELAEDVPGKLIIWSYFRAELAAIANALSEKFGPETVLEYHGGVDDDSREVAKQRFQDRDDPSRFLVGNPKSGGIGLTLTKGTTQIFYSNNWSLEDRKQAEDRSHRIGTENETTHERGVVYIDLEATGTVDEDIVTAVQEKIELANYLNGDDLRKLVKGDLFGRRAKEAA